MSLATNNSSGLSGRISRFFKFIHKELHQEGAYLLPLRIFIGIGWLRAATEKLLEPDWYDGTALESFFEAQREEGLLRFPFYETLIDEVFIPNASVIGWIVIVGQILAGISILTGTFTNLGLIGGLFMNLNFILVGRTNPSAFYVVIQLVLFIGNTGAVLGVDTFLTKKIPYSFLVAQADHKRRFLTTERFSFLIMSIVFFAGAIFSFTYVQDFSPNSVDDPAMLLFILGNLGGMTLLIDFLRLQSPDKDPPEIDSPSDMAYPFGEVGKFIHWHVRDNNPDTYIIMENGKVLKSGNWLSGDEITYSLDHLSVGYHRIVLTVSDWFGNSNSDAIDVTILDPLKTESSRILNLLQYYRETLKDQLSTNESTLRVVQKQQNDLQESMANMAETTAKSIAEKYGIELGKISERKIYLQNTIDNIRDLLGSVDHEQLKISQEIGARKEIKSEE